MFVHFWQLNFSINFNLWQAVRFVGPIEMYVFKGGRGRGSGLKISKTRFRDSGRPIRSTKWVNFLVGFGCPRLLGARMVVTSIVVMCMVDGGHAHFPAKVAQKIKD